MKQYFLMVILSVAAFFQQGSVSAQTRSLIDQYAVLNRPVSAQDGSFLNTIHIRARRDFKAKYKEVNNERWIRTASGESTVVFHSKNGGITILYYNKAGRWKATVKGYMEDQLPFCIRDRVKREYYDFAIEYVSEILSAGGNMPIYIVQIRFRKQIKFIRVGEEMEVWKAFETP